ncbi:hypothetical protein [Brevibacillus gelatini]|uniref:hypothetical protein n=1 Tax=Brevibacillus gelatini TaxID=1655277 RepID=UPI001FE35BF0|nr:hypothetical protein [Brevibacillus gelatini]
MQPELPYRTEVAADQLDVPWAGQLLIANLCGQLLTNNRDERGVPQDGDDRIIRLVPKQQ